MNAKLSQEEADMLIALKKVYRGVTSIVFPNLGRRLNFKVFAKTANEEFLFDVTRGRVKLSKFTFQSRARKTIVLARLDINGSPHRNPDGEELGGTHIHVYKENFGDAYALPLPECFARCETGCDYLDEFMDWCNVTVKPKIEKGLFT